jgi:3-deoxy-7-phosphoheptulonate synthase
MATSSAATPSSHSIVEIAGHAVGAGTLTVIAGPCSVVTAEQTVRVARIVKGTGATMFRGGAYKPRSDPRSFQGMGKEGLAMLREAKKQTGMTIVTELLDVRDLVDVLDVADVVQIGARNMHNTALLKAVGQAGCAVLLKRGLAATIDETISAADYIRCEGNERVILCERGIRTFETAYRFTLDLAAVPILQQRSGLPVIVDPSHAAGRRDLVTRLSKAAVAVGADGLIVEVDESPERALSDGPQQLPSDHLGAYMVEMRLAAIAEGRRVPCAA